MYGMNGQVNIQKIGQYQHHAVEDAGFTDPTFLPELHEVLRILADQVSHPKTFIAVFQSIHYRRVTHCFIAVELKSENAPNLHLQRQKSTSSARRRPASARLRRTIAWSLGIVTSFHSNVALEYILAFTHTFCMCVSFVTCNL